MTLANPIRITLLVTEIFEALNISYMVGGSLASSVHGIPRATQDIDLVADIKAFQVDDLVKAFEKEFYIDADMIQEAIKYQSSCNIIHLETMFKVDIFILKDDLASYDVMSRKISHQSIETPHKNFFVSSAEDIIIQKLQWFQLGGGVSERQWNDILGVFQVQKDRLDYAALQKYAEIRKVGDLLKQAMKDAAISTPLK
ncbi:MAG: hypothetical protein KAH77_06140 [Thiomargarita sp.]|nr:hypothetical protein [Thiomargarita sp.]